MPAPNPVSPFKLVLAGVSLMAWPGAVLLVGGDARWLEGWIFAGWFVGVYAVLIGYLYVKDPALLAERYRTPGSGGQRGWDRWWVYAMFLGYVSWLAAMPLDVRRLHWSAPLAPALEALGAALLLPASFLQVRSFTDNTFLSPLVRLQPERKQHVVSTGVYGFVRHPLYLGCVLMFFAVPLLLGSRVGLAVGAGLTLLLAARIVGEERMLVKELEGYAAYRGKVRYRLVPGVW
jgi:protein-S-isoprenylcysteine O-methyltransferase Ste14